MIRGEGMIPYVGLTVAGLLKVKKGKTQTTGSITSGLTEGKRFAGRMNWEGYDISDLKGGHRKRGDYQKKI